MLESLPAIPASGIIRRLVIPELRKGAIMGHNLNVYGIVMQFLHEANMILTSSGKLEEMPPHIDGFLISTRGEVWLPYHPTSKS